MIHNEIMDLVEMDMRFSTSYGTKGSNHGE